MPFLTRSELAELGPQGPEHLFIRDFQERITPNVTQRNTLIAAGVYIVAIAILWCVSLGFRHAWYIMLTTGVG